MKEDTRTIIKACFGLLGFVVLATISFTSGTLVGRFGNDTLVSFVAGLGIMCTFYGGYFAGRYKARDDERGKLIEVVEKHLGKYKTMTGSMGYQGLIQGITAIQTYQDQQRDLIIEETRTGSKSEGV